MKQLNKLLLPGVAFLHAYFLLAIVIGLHWAAALIPSLLFAFLLTVFTNGHEANATNVKP